MRLLLTGGYGMKKTALFITVMTTSAFLGGLAQAQDAEQKINRYQLNEQIREVAQTAASENTSFSKTERQQEHNSQVAGWCY